MWEFASFAGSVFFGLPLWSSTLFRWESRSLLSCFYCSGFLLLRLGLGYYAALKLLCSALKSIYRCLYCGALAQPECPTPRQPSQRRMSPEQQQQGLEIALAPTAPCVQTCPKQLGLQVFLELQWRQARSCLARLANQLPLTRHGHKQTVQLYQSKSTSHRNLFQPQ